MEGEQVALNPIVEPVAQATSQEPERETVLVFEETREGEEFLRIWTLGIGSDRSLERPKEWHGHSSGFDDFAFTFENWFSGLPGEADRCGCVSVLFVGGKALNIIRYLPKATRI